MTRPPFGRFVETSLPVRKKLPHGRPFLADSLYFITVHAAARDENVLALPALAPLLWDEWCAYVRLRRCHPVLFLVMPDHVHGLFRFPADERMQNIVSAWKRITARRHGVRWQRDFFDHRIRNEEERMEKWDYVVMNPVRKGLVADPRLWPYSWTERDLPFGRFVETSLPPEPDANAQQGRDAPTARPLFGRFVETSLPPEMP